MKIQKRLITVVVFLFFLMALAAIPALAGVLPITTCDKDGIGSVTLVTDDNPPVEATILSVDNVTSPGNCLVKVLVPQAINIMVGLPMGGAWNGRLQSEGGGVYQGYLPNPMSMADGYVGITTDTGHVGNVPPGFPPFFAMLDGSFAMLEPGEPNIPLQIDFSYRSEHLMAVIGKQLIQAFYGQQPLFSYWNGCSDRWPPGTCDGAALPGGLQRHSCRCTRDPL
jgi:hypothetical protein